MIPAGYMAKRIVARPDWITVDHVRDIYSVSGCMSEDFADYVGCWKHNGFWLFDTPDILSIVASETGDSLDGTKVFFYEVHEQQFIREDHSWIPYEADPSMPTSVLVPAHRKLEGYDIVSFFAGSTPECSPLSCNNLAATFTVNEHCLLESLEAAIAAAESDDFANAEPGPLRIFSVYSTSAGGV